jgi:hypothetical protein
LSVAADAREEGGRRAPSGLVVLVDSGTAKANVSNMLADEGYQVSVTDGPEGFRIEAVRREVALRRDRTEERPDAGDEAVGIFLFDEVSAAIKAEAALKPPAMRWSSSHPLLTCVPAAISQSR